jgi:hypothetical protein
MNSKQRVEKVFNKEIPDKAPIAFYAIDSDTVEKILGRPTYWRAKAKSRIAFWENRRDEVVQSWIEDGIELYRKLDFLDIVPSYCEAAGMCPPKDYVFEPPKQIDESTWESKDCKIYRYSPITKDITIIHDPSANIEVIDLESYKWNGEIEQPDDSLFEVVDAFIKEFSHDRFVIGSAAQELAWFLPGGMQTGLLECAMNPEIIKEIYLSQVERENALDNYYIRPGQDAVLWGTDLASQNGPMLSPQMYRNLFLDGFSQRISSVKSHGQKLIKHMCGNNLPLLDMMVEAGIDCYQSVQQSAGMDIAKVQEKYKDNFVVWGGIPVEFLLKGTMEDVRKQVRKVLTEVAPKGRFILGTTHSVAVGTNYDNFMAMIDEYHKFYS